MGRYPTQEYFDPLAHSNIKKTPTPSQNTSLVLGKVNPVLRFVAPRWVIFLTQ